MADEIKEEVKEVKGDKITLTRKELQSIVAESVKAAVEEAKTKAVDTHDETMKQLAEAIVKLREPYKDPKQVLNDEIMRKSMHEQRTRLLKNLELDQIHCTHLQGSHALSSYPSPYGFTSVITHDLDTGEKFGMCTNCGKQWRFGDPDYRTWVFDKKSGNTGSSAGRRWFADPMAAIKAGQGEGKTQASG